MKKILIPLADGFEEIEAMTLIDVFRRADLDVTVAGVHTGEIKGAHGIKVMPDTTLEKVKDHDFEVMIVPGGGGGVENLRKSSHVLDRLKNMHQKKQLIGAICAAPMVLRDAGLTKGLKLTSYPGMAEELKDSQYLESRIVMDGHIVTSRGPATAMEFALKIVEIIAGSGKEREVAEALLAVPSKEK